MYNNKSNVSGLSRLCKQRQSCPTKAEEEVVLPHKGGGSLASQRQRRRQSCLTEVEVEEALPHRGGGSLASQR